MRRLGTDRIDLYLLQWRGSAALTNTVDAMGWLREASKIVRWRVGNLDIDDIEELPSACGTACQNGGRARGDQPQPR